MIKQTATRSAFISKNQSQPTKPGSDPATRSSFADLNDAQSRAAKPKAVPTKVSKVKATATQTDEAPTGLAADIDAIFAKHNVPMPTSARWVVSLIATAVTGGVFGYAGGVLLSFAVAAALTFTGSALVALLVYILGVLATIYASWVAGSFVGGFILSSGPERCYQIASDKVTSGVASVREWFGTSKAAHA